MTMYILFTFLVLIYSSIHIDSHDLEILGSGLGLFSEDHMLMKFYVTVYHHGVSPQRVILTMVECCEVMEGDSECDYMELYGSSPTIIAPKRPANLTLYYPNMYSYNRKGWCLVKLYYHTTTRRDVNAIRHKIVFDTSLWKYPVPPDTRGLINANRLPKCDTPDLDPYDHCNPVNCLIKYSGYRNFFNRKSKRCQRVPVCISDVSKDLPDVIYVPTINICRNIANAVTEEDIHEILRDSPLANENIDDQVVNIRCHHGEIDPRTGLCICDYGWKSEPFDPDLYSPHSVYSMCNVKCYPNTKTRTTPKIMYYLIGFFLALWIASCVMCFDSRGISARLSRSCGSRSSAAVCSSQDFPYRSMENVEDDLENCQTDTVQTEMVCSNCQRQCSVTVQRGQTKTEEYHSLWDITR